ncbi:unnamed protein product [Adineta steineri]|nr:unnamed protein product [Adineta steineri]
MRDAFSDFAQPFLWPYVIFGSCTILSGTILFAIPLLQPKEEEQQNKSNEPDTKMDIAAFFAEKDLSS